MCASTTSPRSADVMQFVGPYAPDSQALRLLPT